LDGAQSGLAGKKRKVSPQIGSLFEAVCGKDAFHHLCSLILSWRDRSRPLFQTNNGTRLAVQIVQTLGILVERSRLTEFLIRFAKVKLAEIIDKGKEHRTSADPKAITALMFDLGWQKTKKNREKLHNYLKEGRQWKRVCGSCNGLLCLIPPNREDKENPLMASGRTYRELSGGDITSFHALLNSNKFIAAMRQMGHTFTVSIWDNVEVPEFRWEIEDPQMIARLPIERLATLMEEFHVIKANEFGLDKYDWPKPDFWPWDWPQSPAWISPSDKRCDECDKYNERDEEECDCITTCLPPNQPSITNEPGKGQGVRVMGATYLKGQILGELLGEFAPLDTYDNGWAMEFTRPDFRNEPIAQIYAREMGNWVRKVNHSCDPSAKFRVMRISGWWRQMLVAVRDIIHNDEITASCGRGFLRGKECLCDVCCNVRLEATS
jgi:hypothetical protein